MQLDPLLVELTADHLVASMDVSKAALMVDWMAALMVVRLVHLLVVKWVADLVVV